MFLNSWPNRKRGEAPPAETASNYFDFAVSTTPVYKRGSGPPLSLPTPSANFKDNEDGTIIDFIPGSADAQPKFLVGSTTRPGLRVTVNVIDIMDWVSARTFEEWNFQRSKEERREEISKRLHWKVQQARERARDERRSELEVEKKDGAGRIGGQIENGEGRVVRKRGRPFGSFKKKVPLVEQVSPGRTRRRVASLIETAAAQPSLTSPLKQHRGLAELIVTDSSEEIDLKDELALNEGAESSEDTDMVDEDTQLASQFHLNGGINTTSRSSVDPLGNDDDIGNMPSPRNGVAQSLSKSPTSASKKTPPKLRINSFFHSNQRLPSKTKRSSPSKKVPTPPPEIDLEDDDEEDDQGEWEVERIITHEVRTDENGFDTLHYKLAWKGDWEPTWEPRDHVSPDLVKEYHAALKSQLSSADENAGKLKRLEDKKRRRQEEEQQQKKRRSTRSISRATTAEVEETKARKRPSRSPAVSYAYHDNENLFGSDDDDDDDDVEMPDVRPRRKSGTKSRSATKSRSGTASREGTASSGMFVSQNVAPIANMFGPPATPTTNGAGNKGFDVKGKGKEVVRNTIELDASPPRSAKHTPPVDKGKGKVIEISSGEESSSDENDDELA